MVVFFSKFSFDFFKSLNDTCSVRQFKRFSNRAPFRSTKIESDFLKKVSATKMGKLKKYLFSDPIWLFHTKKMKKKTHKKIVMCKSENWK